MATAPPPLALLATVAVVGSLACGGFSSPPSAAPEPKPMPQPAQGLPSAAFKPLPGWLGFTVRPRTQRNNPWTPDHPNAKIAIFNPQGWEELSEGTTFRAVTSQGDLEVKYSELSEIPHGCDDTPTLMAAFQGPYDFGEEAVWILPAATEGARSFAVEAHETGAEARAWKAGPFVVSVKKTGERTGELRVGREGTTALSVPFEKPLMEGADNAPLNLADDGEIGLPVPLAAFQLKESMPPVLVTRANGYEGVRFEVFTVESGAVISVGSASVYLCAF